MTMMGPWSYRTRTKLKIKKWDFAGKFIRNQFLKTHTVQAEMHQLTHYQVKPTKKIIFDLIAGNEGISKLPSLLNQKY